MQIAAEGATRAGEERPLVPRLELRGLSKSFGSTRALRGVSLDLLPGEVHVLSGENGAGKSTLIRVLSGVYGAYEGEVRIDGAVVRLASPADARAHGIATIHQELSLVPSLSTVDNLLIAHPGRFFSPISRRQARTLARTILDSLKLVIDPDALVESLPLSERQLLEIARALHHEARILILDEPTSALSEPDAERLFESLSRIRSSGTSILYISHRMDEIFRIADRVTVLRDGAWVFTRAASELSETELVTAMVGRELAKGRPAAELAQTDRGVRLDVRGLRHGKPNLSDIDFELRAGEVLGVCGLRGSGASSLLHALYGARGKVEARIRLGGVAYAPSNPAAAIARGVMLLPSDRHDSVFPELDVFANATLSSLPQFSKWSIVDHHRELEQVREHAKTVGLRASSLLDPAGDLSGGNQQKLALLRCLLTQPKLLLLDDPTRGVDVGAKAEIYELIAKLAESGVSILLVSSELEELTAVCHRVLVLFMGRLVATLDRAELSREKLLSAMMGADVS